MVRLYLGIHYPSDLVAGALLGVAVVWGADALMAARDGTIGRPIMARLTAAEQRSSNWFYAAAFLVSFELTVIFDDVRDVLHGSLRALHGIGYLAAAELALLALGAALVCVAMARRRSLARTAAPK